MGEVTVCDRGGLHEKRARTRASHNGFETNENSQNMAAAWLQYKMSHHVMLAYFTVDRVSPIDTYMHTHVYRSLQPKVASFQLNAEVIAQISNLPGHWSAVTHWSPFSNSP